MAKLLNKFAIGCDPEFVCLRPDGSIQNVVALGAAGPLGYDHSGHVAELRPDPARGAWTLVKRLQDIINNNPKVAFIKGLRWRAGAYYKDPSRTITLGGHVHFDIHREKLQPGVLKALDALTQVLERVEILPQGECISRRTHTQYGKWGDIRTDTPDEHTEYRTMASWLFNPWVTFLALTCAKLAAAAPTETYTMLHNQTDRGALARFVGSFRGADINARRLYEHLEDDDSFLDTKPDDDIKTAWEEPLE